VHPSPKKKGNFPEKIQAVLIQVLSVLIIFFPTNARNIATTGFAYLPKKVNHKMFTVHEVGKQAKFLLFRK